MEYQEINKCIFESDIEGGNAIKEFLDSNEMKAAIIARKYRLEFVLKENRNFNTSNKDITNMNRN
jgi:hypothetical protein